MPLMSLEYDDETEELLEDLKIFFGVKTKSAVIRRALALAKVAKRTSDPKDKTVNLVNPRTEKSETIMLAG